MCFLDPSLALPQRGGVINKCGVPFNVKYTLSFGDGWGEVGIKGNQVSFFQRLVCSNTITPFAPCSNSSTHS